MTFTLYEIMVKLFTTPLQLSEPGNHYNLPCMHACTAWFSYNWPSCYV